MCPNRSPGVISKSELRLPSMDKLETVAPVNGLGAKKAPNDYTQHCGHFKI
jgi:hypothetical protein